MISRYLKYFNTVNPKIHSENVLVLLKRIGIDISLSIEDIDVDFELVKDVLKYGYQGMAYDQSKKISQISDQDRFRVLVNLLPELENIYYDKGIEKQVLDDTLSDLALRVNQYYEDHQIFGLTSNSGHWLLRIFYLKIFKLGSLQYEILNLEFQKLEYDLVWLSEENKALYGGKKVLSVHIMEGSDIRKEAVEKSFDKARIFFESMGIVSFYCCSWLLYPGNKKLLDSKSNILTFAENFDLIATSTYKEHAIFSVFGGDINKLPRTKLQKRAQKNPELLGIGVGVIPF